MHNHHTSSSQKKGRPYNQLIKCFYFSGGQQKQQGTSDWILAPRLLPWAVTTTFWCHGWWWPDWSCQKNIIRVILINLLSFILLYTYIVIYSLFTFGLLSFNYSIIDLGFDHAYTIICFLLALLDYCTPTRNALVVGTSTTSILQTF